MAQEGSDGHAGAPAGSWQLKLNHPWHACRVGLDSMLGPAFSPDASLFRHGVPFDSPLQGHLLWDVALITPGLARRNILPVLYCVLFDLI